MCALIALDDEPDAKGDEQGGQDSHIEHVFLWPYSEGRKRVKYRMYDLAHGGRRKAPENPLEQHATFILGHVNSAF